MKFLASNCSGAFCVEFIIYFIISTLLIIAGLIIICKFVKTEKTLHLIIRIIGAVLLVVIILNRFGYTYKYVEVMKKPGYNWGYMIPETLCGLCSLFMAINCLFFKKDNIALHYLVYQSFMGAIIAHCYPTYLNTEGQYWYELCSITSFLHHSILVFTSLLMLLKKWITPSIRKWYIFPIGYGIFTFISAFDVIVLKTPAIESFVFTPLISSLSILTSWWMMWIYLTIFVLIFLFLYEHFKNKKTFKETFVAMFDVWHLIEKKPISN